MLPLGGEFSFEIIQQDNGGLAGDFTDQLGLRESSAAFGKQPVSNSTCLQCHANFDDRHAPSRFLEPRFEQARAELGETADMLALVAASEAVSTRLGVEGVIIVRTAPGSPAERAGIRGVDFNSGALGDVIVQADGKPVHRLSDLTDQIEVHEAVKIGRAHV